MKLQRYTFEKVGDGYQFTTTTDGLWVMSNDAERLEKKLGDIEIAWAEYTGGHTTLPDFADILTMALWGGDDAE